MNMNEKISIKEVKDFIKAPEQLLEWSDRYHTLLKVAMDNNVIGLYATFYGDQENLLGGEDKVEAFGFYSKETDLLYLCSDFRAAYIIEEKIEDLIIKGEIAYFPHLTADIRDAAKTIIIKEAKALGDADYENITQSDGFDWVDRAVERMYQEGEEPFDVFGRLLNSYLFTEMTVTRNSIFTAFINPDAAAKEIAIRFMNRNKDKFKTLIVEYVRDTELNRRLEEMIKNPKPEFAAERAIHIALNALDAKTVKIVVKDAEFTIERKGFEQGYISIFSVIAKDRELARELDREDNFKYSDIQKVISRGKVVYEK